MLIDGTGEPVYMMWHLVSKKSVGGPTNDRQLCFSVTWVQWLKVKVPWYAGEWHSCTSDYLLKAFLHCQVCKNARAR